MPSRHAKVLFPVLAVIVAMVALVAASYPLYQLFCKVTGYGGTTSQSITVPEKIGSREFTIRFNADIAPELPWKFSPKQKTMRVKIGENALALYESENLSDKPITGMAVYNVTPNKVGKYFHKVQCFCFDEQVLQAKEYVEMPVSFYIDPALAEDDYMNDVKTITLSYTFFRSGNAE